MTDKIHQVTLVSFILSFTIFSSLQVVLPYYFSAKPKDATGISILVENENPGEVSYKEWKKTRSRMKDVVVGEKTTTGKLYSDIVQYEDSNGQWRDVDTNIKKVGGALQVTDAMYRSYFDSSPTADLKISIDGNDVINSYLDSKANKPKIDGNRITYIDAYTNVDIERIFNADSVKQNIVLKKYGHPTEFREKLTSNLRIELQQDNSFKYFAGPKLVATTPPITLVDAVGTNIDLSVKYENDILTLTLPDTKYLTYPLVIDPTTSLSVGSTDYASVFGYTDGYCITQQPKYLSSNYFYIVYYPIYSCNQPGEYRSYLRFPLAGITGPINSATLYMALGSGTPQTPFKIAHSNAMTPGTDLGSTLWSTGYYSASNVTAPTSLLAYKGYSVTDYVQSDISASRTYTHYQLLHNNGSNLLFASPAYTDITYDPYLEITYGTAAGIPYNFTGTAQSESSINWTWGDVNNETGYRVHDAANNNLSGDLAAGTTTWSEGMLTPNTGYQRHVHSFDANGESTASQLFTSYTFSPPPSVSELDLKVTNTTYNANDAHFTFQSSNSFGPGGVGYYRYAWDTTATHTWTNTEQQWSTGNLNLTANLDGSYYLHLRSYNGGNVPSGDINVGPYLIDVTMPKITGFDIVGSSGSQIYTSGLVNISITGTDIAQMRFSNNGTNWSDWESYAAVKNNWDLTAVTYGGNGTEGEKKVYAEFKDTAGNIGGTNWTTSINFTNNSLTTNTATTLSNIVASNDTLLLAKNLWTTGSTATEVPERYEYTKVWTGTDLIIFGGLSHPGNNSNAFWGDGAKYNVATDTWTSLGARLSGRYKHTAVWTGSKMIVWGGQTTTGNHYNDGVMYEPSTDTWTPMSTVGAPAARSQHTAVWTGSKMIVWGGYNNNGYVAYNSGGVFDPATNTWSATSLTNAPATMAEPTAVWTGTKMIVWGQFYSIVGMGGGAYDPISNTWTTIQSNSLSTREKHSAVWTGSKMIIWGGCYSQSCYNDGAMYDPVSDTWVATADPGLINVFISRKPAIWTGTRMLVKPDSSLYSFDPVANSWGLATNGGGVYTDMVWTGDRVVGAGGPAYASEQIHTSIYWPNYITSGTMSGLKYDAGTTGKARWNSVQWHTQSLPAGTLVKVRARTSDDNAIWSAWSQYFEESLEGASSGMGALSSLAESRYLEVAIELSTTNTLYTPTVNDLSVSISQVDTILYETSPPTVFDLVSPGDNTFQSPSPLFSWQASSDAGSGLAKYQLFVDGLLNVDNIAAGATSQTAGPFSDGAHTWYVKALDLAGNARQSTSTWTLSVDSTGPTLVDNQLGDDTWRHENSGLYNVDFTDAGTGLSKFETKVTTASNYGGTLVQDWTKVADITGSSYTTDWALLQTTWDILQEGTNYVYVRTTDIATNSYQSLDYVFYVKKDTVLPTSGVTTNGYYGSASSPWTGVSGTAADTNGSGVQKTEIKILGPGNKYWNGSSWVDQISWVEATGTTTWSYVINQSNFQDGSTYSVEARTTDVAGNLQTILSSGSFTYDSTFPVGSININNGAAYSSSSIVALRFPNTSADVDKMKLSNNNTLTADGSNLDSGNWINYNAGPINWNLSAGNGVKNIYVVFRDLTGNESLQAYSAQIFLDLFVPTSSISGPANLSKLNNLIALTGTVTEEGIGFTGKSQVTVAIINGAGLYWNGVIFDTPETWNEVTTLTGTLPNFEWTYTTLPNFTNGNYTVKVKAVDDAGNSEIAGAGNTFTFDNVQPTIDSLTSATHIDQNTWYGVHDVSVAWAGNDTATGNTSIVGYSYVFDQTAGTTPDEVSEGVITSESYVGVADGAWYFHVRTKDGAGNWSNPAHYTIRIDLTGPVEGTPTFAANGIDDTKIEVSFGKFIDHSGPNEYKIYRATVSGTPSATTTSDPGINPTTLTYPNLVTTITDNGSASYSFTDSGLSQGWYYYSISVTDKSNPVNTSTALYSHSKTNFIPANIVLSVNGGSGPININPTDGRTLALSWQTTDPDGQGDIVTTKVTVKQPDNTVLATYDQTDGRMARTNIANGYSITASYTLPSGIGYGNYAVYVTTIDSIGLSAHIKDSNTVTVKLIAESVPGLTATGIKSTEIDLAWQVPQITGGLRATNRYQVERKLSSDPDSSFAQIGLTNDLTYINTGLNMAVSYSYRVRAYDVSDNPGLWSQVASAAPPKPVMPDALALKDVSASSVDLGGTYPVRYLVSWNAVGNAQVPDFRGYKLYREVDNVWEGAPIAEINCNTLGLNQTYYLALHPSSDAGKVYRYKVATWDEANNVGDFAETPATNAMVTPMITAQPTVIDRGVSFIKLSWSSNLSTESVVQYKKTSDGDYTNFAGSPVATSETSGANYVNTVTIDGLEKGTSYDFKVQSMTTAGFLSAESPKITGETKPFNINYDSNTGKKLSSSSAEISWNTGDVQAQGYIEYKKGNAGETKVVGTGKDATSHFVVLTDLSEGDYVFTLKNIDQSGNITTSALQSFTITGFTTGTISAPQAGKIEEQDITATSAKITWTSTVATSSWIDYGNQSNVYTKSTGNDTLTVDHVVNMDGLVPGETYYYIVRGVDANGVDYKSKEYSFIALAKPNISSVKVNDVTSYTARIDISVTKDVQASVSYGKDGRFDLKAGNTKLAKDHEVKLDNLEDNSSYSYFVDVIDSSGNTARSQSGTFNTPIDTTGPEIKDVKTDILPLGEADEFAQVIISWTTSKPATTKIEYGEGLIGGKYEKNSVPDDSLNTSHTVILKDIRPATTYHFRLVSKDKRGNETKSNDYTFVAPTKEKSILQLIIKSLEETFSWVSNVGQFFRNLGRKVN